MANGLASGRRSEFGPSTVLLFFYVLYVCLVDSVVYHETENSTYKETEDIPSPIPTSTQTRWADAAVRYIANISCSQAYFTTHRQCGLLQARRRHELNVYIAGPSAYGRLRAVVPDGGLQKAGAHDGVVVIDPYPQANFGHLVVVMFVDMRKSRKTCIKGGGMYLGYGECLTLSAKRRCKNALESRRRRRNFARRCELNFLPLVYWEKDPRRRQLLSCKNSLAGFGPCPTLRPQNETSGLVCNPLRENNKRCETSQFTINTNHACRVFEMCDHAVIISGGWNKHTSLQRHKDNVGKMYRTLRKNGFVRRNIKLFFANGMRGIAGEEKPHVVYPATLKLAMRYHIQKLCRTAHCADTFVIYMNNPSKIDGTSLLWDHNNNGVAEESERYTSDELLSDLEGCAARQVKLIVDQSYSGEIVRTFRRNAHNHRNVAVYSSSRDHEFSWGSEYTDHWSRYPHTNACTKQVHEASRNTVRHSTPDMCEKGSWVRQTTLFGSPCNMVFTKKELRDNYYGCQNLPTAIWTRRHRYRHGGS